MTNGNQPPKLEDMVKQLQTGEMNPGSSEGIEAIRQIAKASPGDLTARLFHIPNDILERGMKAAGMSEDDIEDILKTDEDDMKPVDPFAGHTELTPDDSMLNLNSPLEYDPALDLSNGPRRN